MLPLPPFCRPLTLCFSFYLYMFSSWLVPSLLHFSTPTHPITVLPALYASLSRALILFPLHALGGLQLFSPSWPPFFLLCFCSTLLCSLHIYLLCVLFLPPSLVCFLSLWISVSVSTNSWRKTLNLSYLSYTFNFKAGQRAHFLLTNVDLLQRCSDSSLQETQL